MSRALLVLYGTADKAKAIRWIDISQPGTRVTFQGPKRSLDQNSKLWASLTDIATQVKWHGVRLTADDWKLIFLDALKREMRLVPNLDGTAFVNLGRSSSELSKAEFSELIELIIAWGVQHGVVFHDHVAQAEPEKADA